MVIQSSFGGTKYNTVKYVVVIIGAIILWLVHQDWFLFTAPTWVFAILALYSHKENQEYKILERKDGFGTTYIPILVYHNTLFWWKWDICYYVHKESVDSVSPDKHTYFEGALHVIGQYKLFLEKSKVKTEINERDIS